MKLHLTASLAGSGFHPAAWRLGPQPAFPIGRRVQQMAALAEGGGLDAVWLGAGDPIRLDPLPLLGSLIAGTTRIGLGAHWGVDGTEPFHVARVFATLDHLAHGRTAWIVGLPADDADLPRAAELIQVTRKLWDSWEDEGFLLDVPSGRFADPARVHPIAHAGRFFSVRGPLNVPRPVQGNPPLVMTVPASEAGRRFATANADVLLLDAATPDAAASQRPAGARVLVNVMTVLGATEDVAQQRADALDSMGTPQPDAALRFVGTPARLVDLFAAWAGVCDGFNILPAVLPDDLALFVDAAVPMARARGLATAGYKGTTLRDHLGLARPRSRYAA